jgi:hypothetical protein
MHPRKGTAEPLAGQTHVSSPDCSPQVITVWTTSSELLSNDQTYFDQDCLIIMDTFHLLLQILSYFNLKVYVCTPKMGLNVYFSSSSSCSVRLCHVTNLSLSFTISFLWHVGASGRTSPVEEAPFHLWWAVHEKMSSSGISHLHLISPEWRGTNGFHAPVGLLLCPGHIFLYLYWSMPLVIICWGRKSNIWTLGALKLGP